MLGLCGYFFFSFRRIFLTRVQIVLLFQSLFFSNGFWKLTFITKFLDHDCYNWIGMKFLYFKILVIYKIYVLLDIFVVYKFFRLWLCNGCTEIRVLISFSPFRISKDFFSGFVLFGWFLDNFSSFFFYYDYTTVA